VASDLALSYRHPVESGGHYYTETPASAPRHAECADCHEAHAATAAEPGRGSSYVSVDRTQNPWQYNLVTSPGLYSPPWGICYKCHSGYSQTRPPGQRDVAQDFDPANRSFHAVEAEAATYIPDGAFVGGWTYRSRVNCGDCHRGTARGPHGAAYPKILPASHPDAGPMNGTEFCFRCHAPDVYLNGADESGPPLSRFFGTVGGQAGKSLHRYHIQTKGGVCADCHQNAHGSANLFRLLTLNSKLTAVDEATPSCQASCHQAPATPYPWQPAY
jgi:mono/diheme cytochrome c family protein